MVRLALVSLLLTGCAQKSELDAATARLEALEAKVAAMEKAPAGKGAAAPVVNTPEEEEAGKLMQALQEAMKANDYGTAKDKLAVLQTEKFKATRGGKAAARMAPEINLIGSTAVPIETEKWFQGKADYKDSKATLVVFWEIWCPHCKKEMPNLVEKEAKLKAKGVQILAMTKVTKTATDEKVEEFLKETKVKFPVGKEKDASMSKGFAVSGIPAAALVKDGVVVWRGHPARLDDALLDKLLAG